jgi:hypothetical protein
MLKLGGEAMIPCLALQFDIIINKVRVTALANEILNVQVP